MELTFWYGVGCGIVGTLAISALACIWIGWMEYLSWHEDDVSPK